MNTDAFAKPSQAAFGALVARAWQDSLESWWQTLLGDPNRLRELAGRMSGLAPSTASSSSDLGRVLAALELFEKRMSEIESQVQSLAGSLGLLVQHLQGPGEGRSE